jgi:outer membrane protein assembly factor BamB
MDQAVQSMTGRMRRAFPLLSCGLVLILKASLAQQAPAPVPTDLDGKWWGEVRHGPETGELGVQFERRPDGSVLVREWMSNLNAYGLPVGRLQFKDGKFFVPEANVSLSLRENLLTGSMAGADLTLSLRRSDKTFPTEPQPTPVSAGPTPSWDYKATGPIWASPITDHGIVFVGDSNGTLHAVDAANGKAKWTFRAGSGIFGAAAVRGDALFFAADDGFLYKLNRNTGARFWRASIGGGDNKRVLPSREQPDWDARGAAPALYDNVIYIGSADGILHALDIGTGKPLWNFKTNGKIRAAALATENAVYVGSLDHFLYALDCKTGVELWRFDTGSPVTTTPVLVGDKVIIGTRDHATLYALDVKNGKPIWEVYYWLSWVESSPVLVDGLLYIGSSDSRRVRAIDPVNGRVIWAAQVWGWTWGTPLVVDDVVYYATGGTSSYFITQTASLGALDRQSGALMWRKPVPLRGGAFLSGYANSLAYAGGKIIAAGLDGTLQGFAPQAMIRR